MVRPLPFDFEIFWPLLVEEQFVIEALRRRAAERRADLARQLDRVDQILAGHFVVDAERKPAHRPVRLPLQLAVAAGDGDRDALLRFRIVVGDGAGLDVVRNDRHVQHHAGARADRQERRVARGALLAKRRQHDLHDRIEPFQHAQQRGVETARRVVVGRTGELVVEAEGVEKRAQPCVVVRTETVDGYRTGRAHASAVGRDAAPAAPCSARCPAPCAGRPCRRRTPSSRVLTLSSVSTRNAWRTMVVRATSPKVPICGRPDGP